jgi:hypothetical protein
LHRLVVDTVATDAAIFAPPREQSLGMIAIIPQLIMRKYIEGKALAV